jgi:NAD(P)-dependent dehydrogenase (short-subunit alcohol dehydrogenase family)
MPDTRFALVTGATAGLGRAVAAALAERGMHILVHGRDAGRAAAVVDQIAGSGGTAQAVLADLASLEQARELADQVSADHDALALLVNNAGVGAGRPPYRKRQLSADGHELRLAVNYLAPALLARRLIPALKNGAPARIVNVGSVGQAPVDFADLRMDNHYTGAQAYYRSKFALAAFTFDLAEELANSGITVNCVHPASLMNTHMVRESMIPPHVERSQRRQGGHEPGRRAGRRHPHRTVLRRHERGQGTRGNLRPGDPVPAAHDHQRAASALLVRLTWWCSLPPGAGLPAPRP